MNNTDTPKRCESCWTAKAHTPYTSPEGGTYLYCDTCAERMGLKERESIEDLLARLGA